ncbi:MAG TPA: hypothetical protein VGS41_16045 [Chthonomonadales bacterium]|nr:hypothetical protein [Chthonomonadales bacterium]
MMDLTPYFLEARARPWSETSFRSLLEALRRKFPALKTRWDDGVPEHWAALEMENEFVGLVCVNAALAILLGSPANVLRAFLETSGVVVVGANDYTSYDYMLDIEKIQTAYPMWSLESLDMQLGHEGPALSINDIYYLTVS